MITIIIYMEFINKGRSLDEAEEYDEDLDIYLDSDDISIDKDDQYN